MKSVTARWQRWKPTKWPKPLRRGIGIAAVGIEAGTARRRAKDFQPRHAIAAADRGKSVTLFVDVSQHLSLRTFARRLYPRVLTLPLSLPAAAPPQPSVTAGPATSGRIDSVGQRELPCRACRGVGAPGVGLRRRVDGLTVQISGKSVLRIPKQLLISCCDRRQ